MDDCDSLLIDLNPKVKASNIKSKKHKHLKIQRALDRLKHACECLETNCNDIDCDEMKSIVIHSKLCELKPRKNCRSCRQLLALCLYHVKRSKDCETDDCLIPYCARIKHSLMLKKKILRKQLRALYKEDVAETPTLLLDDSQPDTFVPSTNSKSLQLDQQPLENVESNEEAPRSPQAPRPPSPSPNADPIVKENAHDHLKKLLHAHECLSGEMRGAVSAWPCSESNCNIWKNILQHIITCFNDNCTMLHCSSSKHLFTHWETCRKKFCLLCTPIRETIIFQVLAFEEGLCHFPAIAMAASKQWHSMLPQNWRANVVTKMVEAFLPGSTLNNIQLCQIIRRLKEFENYEYIMADSKLQYCNRLVDLTQCIVKKVRHNRYNIVLKEKRRILLKTPSV